ncbi:MAG: glycosyltransferase family 2 protein [Terracoccus sp.]
MHRALVRLLVTGTLLFGTIYVGWRWGFSVNWAAWWIAVPLVVAETYSLIDAYLFGLTVWRIKERPAPEPPAPDATVDVFITTYNEPVEMVMATAREALAIRHPHTTWVLDDGDRPEMRDAAAAGGVQYLTRTENWRDRPRHAKAGNLNNALLLTEGEFMLILDADQIPDPRILDHTLGYFRDDRVALVQTPQWFSNVTPSDPLGSQAPLFYGPLQQGKDGWNAAFFCGSNAVLRRDALMQLGIVGYVRDVRHAVDRALRTSSRVLTKAARTTSSDAGGEALEKVREAVSHARNQVSLGVPVSEVTWALRGAVDAASRTVVDEDLRSIRADLAVINALTQAGIESDPGSVLVHDEALDALAERDLSPLASLTAVAGLVRAVDVGLDDEAQPMMPLATVSVTEDMATCMRLHGLGWSSVYHHEILAHGLAPEDLGTMLQQRLRWAQGTMQVMMRENPLVQRGLTVPQRLMYFSTMWSYLSGFATVVYLVAPVLYLCFGVLPVEAYGLEFIAHFVPYIVMNQLLFLVVGRGVKTWRGQQYSLALFPLWIRACTTAASNVVLGTPLGFVVTPKTRQATAGFPVRLVLPQLIASVVLVSAAIVGVVRLLLGADNTGIGTLVNVLWVGYDLVALSVIFQAALFRGPDSEVEPPAV